MGDRGGAAVEEQRFVADVTAASHEPLYNIGVVERMTGVPIATLRVWERRYGFPQTTRTSGGHRLYSESEVRRLRWVKARVDEGMQAGQAVRALEHMDREGRVPETPTLVPPTAQVAVGDPSLAHFGARLANALMAHDIAQADQSLGELLALYPLESLIADVIQPAWRLIGDAYLANRISVATEHLASQYLRHRLVAWLPVGPAEYPVRPTVLACAPGEWHEGSLLILGVMLRRHRWPVSYLGQAVPLPDLAAFVNDVHPPAVVVVAMTEESAAALAAWPEHLPDAAQTGRPPICFGGRVFAEKGEWQAKVPGIYLGDSLESGLATLEHRLREITGVA